MFCDILTPEGTPYEGDPRHVLRRALERMIAMGFDAYDVGVEPEYFLFRDRHGTEPLDEGGYFDLTTLDAGSDVRRETVLALEQLGIPVSTSHHEGAPSQHEIALRANAALKMADDVVTYRITVKEYAINAGWHATFMPKPLEAENGSGMHTHLALGRGRPERLPGRRRPLRPVADRARLHRRPAAPRPRAVERVRPVGQLLQAPRAGLRGAGVRRLEPAQPQRARARPAAQRPHGAALPRPGVQPVPDVRVLLQAGPRGDREGLRPPEPMEKNLYHLSPDDRRRMGIEQLPETLGEAIEITAESELVLRTLGEHMFNRFVRSSARSGRTTACR
jgi:glutamine synthetase